MSPENASAVSVHRWLTTRALLASAVFMLAIGAFLTVAPCAFADGKSYQFSGSGQRAVGPFSLDSGLSVFEVSTGYTSGYFGATLYSSRGEYIDLLANAIGTFSGSKATRIDRAGSYYVQVDSECAWTIKVTQPRPTSAPSTRNFKGSTQVATPIFYIPSGMRKVYWTHSGTGYFGVTLLDRNGEWVELVANTIGSGSGSQLVDFPASGLYLFDVDAESPWTITIQVPSKVSISAPLSVKYGAAATVKGTLRTSADRLLSGQKVTLQVSKDGKSWSDQRTTLTDANGAYSMKTNDLTSARYVRVRYSATKAYAGSTSPVKIVKPKVLFSDSPRFSTYAHTFGKGYSAWGFIKPKHAAGSTQIKVKAYRYEKKADGTYAYVYKKTYLTKITNPEGSAYSKYKGTVKLPSKGKWRLRAYHAEDSKNAKSYSAYRYVTVR